MGHLRGRAFRRWQVEKRKKKWLKDRMNAWGELVDYLDGDLREWLEDPKSIGIGAKTPCRCSCWLCSTDKRLKYNETDQVDWDDDPH